MTNLRSAIARNRLLKPPRRAKRQHEEGDFQTTVVDLLEAILPNNAVCTSIDHANARNALAGADRKRRGVLPGIADIYVAWEMYTMWFECKARLGRLNDDQESFRDAVMAIGHYWCAPRTLEDVVAALAASHIPTKRVQLMPSGAQLIVTI
jgi:hypothetical protein